MGIAVVMAGLGWLAGCGLGAAILLGVGLVCMILGAGGFCFALSLLIIESYCARVEGGADCSEERHGDLRGRAGCPPLEVGVKRGMYVSSYSVGDVAVRDVAMCGDAVRVAGVASAVSAGSVDGVVEVRGVGGNRGPPGCQGVL